MKYCVVTDKNGYVTYIRHTGTAQDYVELDLKSYDFSQNKINAYKLGKNELIFDEERYQQIKATKQSDSEVAELIKLKELLVDSDYILIKWVEEIVNIDNRLTWIADVISISVKYLQKYADILKKRKIWRNRVDEIESKQ